MKRVVLLLLLASSAAAAEKWWDSYNRGVAAVNGRSYEVAAAALQLALRGNPTESTAVKGGNTIITYVPHFWLGIAKFELGDTDGALREWRISEDQGAVARTAYYSKMKDWIARAQLEKQRDAENAAAGPKKVAEAAISRAMQIQGDALSAGGDRTQSYRDAQRKLQEAVSQLRKAGTDVAAYSTVAKTADQAAQLFSTASDEGKKLRAAAAARPKSQPQKPTGPIEVVIPMDETEVPVTPPKTTTVESPKPVELEPAPVETQAKVAAELAVQSYRRVANDAKSRREADALRRELAGSRTDAEFDEVRKAAENLLAQLKAPEPVVPTTTSLSTVPPTSTAAPVVPPAGRPDLGPAYRAFARGDLASADQLLTRVIATTPAAEAYLLRGCVRHTKAMLARTPESEMAAATEDFRAALQRNRALRLDPAVFSPKLVARFEQLRNGG